VVVLSITILKEAWDDFQRYRRDKEMNNKKHEKLTRNGIKMTTSAKMKVGDIIKVNHNERVPADMVLLHCTEKNGTIFIRTD